MPSDRVRSVLRLAGRRSGVSGGYLCLKGWPHSTPYYRASHRRIRSFCRTIFTWLEGRYPTAGGDTGRALICAATVSPTTRCRAFQGSSERRLGAVGSELHRGGHVGSRAGSAALAAPHSVQLGVVVVVRPFVLSPTSCRDPRCSMRACNMQHSACSMQNTICSMQHATHNVQHAACDMQNTTCIARHATFTMQRAAGNVRHAPMQLATCTKQHGPSNMQRTLCNVHVANCQSATGCNLTGCNLVCCTALRCSTCNRPRPVRLHRQRRCVRSSSAFARSRSRSCGRRRRPTLR